MAKQKAVPVIEKRKPRLLWANPFCLLDTSSGASMSVRQMLRQLAANGYEVQILGATIFDNPKGAGLLKEQFPDLNQRLHQLIEANDGPLMHQMIVSNSFNRNHLTSHEESLWYSQYLYMLDSFKPDVVWFYGGQTLDLLIADEARDRGIAVAFYLANGSYQSPRWCRDVDLIVTDSQATAKMYQDKIGFVSKPVGKFIDSTHFVAEHHERRRVLFVNPSWQKGVSIFVQLAEKLERERPDIELEVVEARADWSAVLRETTQRMGQQRRSLKNVTVTGNTSDMRGPYSRARVLVAPSLWWESSGRVLAEAMLNGIPALITNRGGMPEMVGDAGIAFDFPTSCYEEPYQHFLDDKELQPLFDAVVAFYDDDALYQQYVARAFQVGEQKHHIDRATERLLNAFAPLVRERAGNKDFSISQKKRHRQRLPSRATRPELKVDRSLEQLINGKSKGVLGSDTQTTTLHLAENFTWQLKGKIIVLDNRASLIKRGLADQMAATGAFGIVAFDPASEIKTPKQYEGSDTIQLFQHALLGDGQPTTLHACVAPEMSSTLAPLPAEQLPGRYHLGTQEIAELPINTVALDSITGLESLDWLILDELSDAMAVLENGKQYLEQTLLIQARVPFQLTHDKQPSLAELQYWASRNGFRFYRFHNISHYSHLPEKVNERSPCASEQESADILLLPDAERLGTISKERKVKLAFILSSVFAAHDIAFELLSEVDQDKALAFLEARSLLPRLPEQRNVKSVMPPAGPVVLPEEHHNGKPLVSVFCATYNHVDFLEEAIQGIIAQRTRFPFEVIIHDDASTDGTQEIIRKYASQYPDLIKPVYQEKNLFRQGIKATDFCFPRLQGKYVALCEGDDYWTDPEKLQKQFDFMESNEEVVMCHHDAFIFDKNGEVAPSKLRDDFKRSYTQEEMLRNNCFILTLSMFFRKKFTHFPEEKSYVGNGDSFLIALLGQYGKSHYMEDITPAAYRLHGNSIWSSKSVKEKNKMQANTFKWMSRYYKRMKKKDLADYYAWQESNFLKES
ncbi:glycosyltransferase [Halomonas dongshanensis]|uniref:Glycosyltransferase n=1 Tax=Halomonas dongshanensis TaxID=2890835 RepID=A0ABT2ECC8_9GAMM|nr:glycosyltransferase [Halomonas dongshanensis]MCS2608329.1 glycosyltransferase [Halomonas dongshanensis]